MDGIFRGSLKSSQQGGSPETKGGMSSFLHRPEVRIRRESCGEVTIKPPLNAADTAVSTAFADLTPGVCFTLVGWLIQSHLKTHGH